MKHLQYFFIGVGIMILAASSIVFVPYVLGAFLRRFQFIKRWMEKMFFVDEASGLESELTWFLGVLFMVVCGTCYALGMVILS